MNRIFFKGNPYPKGHRIKEFIWSGRLKKDIGLIFDFHLKTEDYYAEDKGEEKENENTSDWKSKIVWGNYHRCTMSSRYWEGNGIVVGNKQQKMDFSKLLNSSLVADSLPEANDYDNEDLAFNIYLLGHDDCANHKISFVKQHGNFTFDIEWNGNIALSYTGDYEYKYSFEAAIEKIQFEGISFDNELSKIENEKLLKSCSGGFSAFEIVENKFILK